MMGVAESQSQKDMACLDLCTSRQSGWCFPKHPDSESMHPFGIFLSRSELLNSADYELSMNLENIM